MNDQVRSVSLFEHESTPVPNWLIRKVDLSPAERLTVIVLLMHEQNNEAPTLQELAELLGYKSSRNVQILIKSLTAAGIVKSRQLGGNRPALYFILNPDAPRSKAKKRHGHDRVIVDDPQIVDDHTIMAHASRSNAEKRHGHDHTIMATSHVGGVLHSGSCVDSDSEQPPTQVQPAAPAAPAAPATPLTELAKWLFRQKVSSAREFAHLDYNAAKADFEERKRNGQSIGAIVKIWREMPPTPEVVAESGADVAYSPAWFAKMRREKPEYLAGYSLGSDNDDQPEDDDLLDDDQPENDDDYVPGDL